MTVKKGGLNLGGRKKMKRKKTQRKRKQQKKYTRQRGGLVTRSHPAPRSNTTHYTKGGRRNTRKGSKSKTHTGKNFETRKTSKKYNSKRWKRMTGRRTIRAPLFPFV